jgi:hypothetical protein
VTSLSGHLGHVVAGLGGVAAAALLAAALRGGLFERPAPAPPGYVRTEAPGLTVYAPTAADARFAEREIAHARAAFRHRLGVDAAPIVVVLVDDPGTFRELGAAGLRRRGAAFLPFATPAHFAAMAPADSVAALDRGIVLARLDGALRVVAAGEGSGLVPGDTVLALGGAPVSSLSEVERHFRAVAPGASLRLRLRRGGAVHTLTHPRGRADTAAAARYLSGRARSRRATKPLSHEACHKYVAALAGHARAPARDAPSGTYGHAALPDWADEMAATLCEAPAERALRRNYLRANLENRIPLDRLATMEHPVSVAMRTHAGPPARPADGVPFQVVRGEALRELLRDTDAGLFYAQSLSVGEFLYARGGAAGLRTLFQRLTEGDSLARALAAARRRAPALPATPAALEAAWLEWLATQDVSR